MKLKISTFLLFVGILLSPFLSKAQPIVTAVNDNVNALAGGTTPIQVLLNDFSTAPFGDSLYIIFCSNPSHGNCKINDSAVGIPDNISYTPNVSFICGYDTFFYIVGDTATPTTTDTAWVYVTVGTIPNVPPSIPTSISLSTPVCTGDTIFFSCNPGINTAHWSGPNAFTSTQSSGFIKNAALVNGGVYKISVSNASNCYSKDTSITVVVKNAPILPVITASQNPACIGKNINLSFAPVTGGATISWSGPNSFSGSNISYNYGPITAADAGTYSVSLTLNGCVKTDTIHLATKNCPVPVSGFTANNDTICSGTTITFTDTSLNNPTSWNWTFNSLANVNISPTPSTSLSQNPTITFTNSSAVIQPAQISFIASNSNGLGSNNNSFIVYIRPSKPVAAFSASKVTICKDSSINFTDASSNNPTTWAWSFAGATTTTSSIQNPSNIIYPNANTSTTVNLTVSNFCGSDSKSLAINVITVPLASFTTTPTTTLCNHTPIFFNDASLNATLYNWDFGNTHTSSLQNPIDSYLVAGTYPVTLIATNACGTSIPFTNNLVVKNCSPSVAQFSFYTLEANGDTTRSDTVCMNTPVYFNDMSINGPSTPNWTFQGATPGASNSFTPVTSFNAEGIYTVTLTSQNIYGQSTYTHKITVIRCLPPVASFFGSTQVCVGQCANFTNTTSEFPDSILWKFGGASYYTSKLWTPIEPCYKNVGIYSVKVIACNKYGCDSVENFITVMPSPRIISTDTCIEAGYTVKLQADGNGLITWMPNYYLNTDLGDTVKSTPINKVTYTVHDTTLCPSPDSVTICLNYSNTYITTPNTFTPDNNGRNDIFKITSNIPLLEYEMKIYNRWGVQVFISNDYLVGWDGMYKGTLQNSGVFIYVINYRDLGSNEYKSIHGNVTLIR